jgi:recombination protein RecA
MDERERRHAIDVTLSQLDKQFGKGAVLRLGSGAIVPVAVISSGSI